MFCERIREVNRCAEDLSDEQIKKIADDLYALNRMWQLVTRKNIELRGEDYEDGNKHAKAKQVQLGYYHSPLAQAEKERRLF